MCRLSVQPVAAHDPDLLVRTCRRGDGIAKAGPGKDSDLLFVELLAAEVRRVDLMRVDKQCVDAGAAEHGGGGRSGKPASDDCDVRVPHVLPFRPTAANSALNR